MSYRTALTRTNVGRGSIRTFTQITRRRQVGGTSTPPHNKSSPDLKWIVGGAVALVPLAYFFSGWRANKNANDIAKEAQPVPKASGQAGFGGSGAGAPQPEGNVKDSGKGGMGVARPVGRQEGKEVAQAMQASFRADAPKTAFQDEAEQAKKHRP